MARVTIEVDELYPFFEIRVDSYPSEFEVDEETLRFWQQTMEDFYDVQDQMREVYYAQD